MPLAALALLNFGILTLLLLETEEAGKPSPPQAPYNPPFNGGQCEIPYNVRAQNTDNGVISTFFSIPGPINGIVKRTPAMWSISRGNGGFSDFDGVASGVNPRNYVLIDVTPSNPNHVDSCGDIPNPHPPLDSIANGGYGEPPSNVQGDDYEPTILLAPIIAPGGAIAAAAAAAAAAKAAIAAAAAAAAVANSISELGSAIGAIGDAIGDFFGKQEEYEEEKEKEKEREEEKKKKKEIWRQRLGTIRNDGILSLVPKDTNESIKLLYLEINFVNIPDSIGKYFGEYSPNRYPYGYGLGYIGFYGAGAGIRELHNMEFRRNSIRIPSDTLGFIYHLGLNTSTSANVDLIYEREVQG